MRILVFCTWFLLIAMGCKKDIAPNNKEQQVVALAVVKAIKGSQKIVINENSYDNDGNIKSRISYKDYPSRLIAAKADYVYEDHKLAKIDNLIDYSSGLLATQYSFGRVIFDYTGNRITQVNSFLKNGNEYELRSFSVFEYTPAGLPGKELRYTADGALIGYNVYEYSESGNVISSSQYSITNNRSTPVLILKNDYTYDAYNNPYKNVYNLVENIPFSVNSNNIAQTISVNYADAGNPQSTTTLTTYSYNAGRFPFYMNENGSEFSLEYK